MKLKSLGGIIIGTALLISAPLALAQSMFDNFDSYSPGSIAGQGVWEGWEGNASVAGTVTTLQASSGTQSLQVVAGNDTVRPYSGVVGGLWTLTLQQYVPSTSSGGSWVILMNSYPANLNWSVQLYTDISGNFMRSADVPSASVALVTDQWVDVRFEINLDANSVTSYYNNTLLATHAWQSGGLNELRALDLYPDEDAGGGTIQVGPVFYDNLGLTAVPEPSTLGLLLLGGLAVLLRRRMCA